MRTLRTFSYRKKESSYKGLNETLAEIAESESNWDLAARYWHNAAKYHANARFSNDSVEFSKYLQKLVERSMACARLAEIERMIKC